MNTCSKDARAVADVLHNVNTFFGGKVWTKGEITDVSNKIAYKIFVDIVINNDISGYQVSIDKYNLLDVIKYYNEHYDSYDKYYQIFDNDNIVNLLIDKYEEYKSSNDYLIFIYTKNLFKLLYH